MPNSEFISKCPDISLSSSIPEFHFFVLSITHQFMSMDYGSSAPLSSPVRLVFRALRDFTLHVTGREGARKNEGKKTAGGLSLHYSCGAGSPPKEHKIRPPV